MSQGIPGHMDNQDTNTISHHRHLKEMALKGNCSLKFPFYIWK